MSLLSTPIRGLGLTSGALVAVSILSSCLSKAITKDQAGELVKASESFNRPKFAHIPRQITFQGGVSSPSGTEGILSIAGLASVDPTLAILKLARTANVNESIYGSGQTAMHQLVVVPAGIDSASLMADEDPNVSNVYQGSIIDDEGRLLTSSTGRFNKEIGWRVPIGTRQFLRVEQIHNWRDVNENIPVNELAIDFTWRWMPNEFGEAFDSRSETFRSFPDTVQTSAKTWGVRMNTEVAMLSRAYLHRNGEQWQLRAIQWSFGRGNPR